MRVRVTEQNPGEFLIWFTDHDGSETFEKVPASVGDQLLHDRIKYLGLSAKTERLLNGEEVYTPSTRFGRGMRPP